VARLDEALGALGRPVERGLVEVAIDLRLDLRAALLPLGGEARVLRLLREAEALAAEIADLGRLGRVADSLSFHHWLRGEPGEAVREGRRALDLAEASGDATLAIIASHHLGLASYTQGDYRAAIAAFRRTIASLTGDLACARLGLVNPPAITARSYLTWCLGEVGEFGEAAVIGQEGLGLAEALGPPVGILAAARGLASVWVRQGDLDRARPLLERGLALCRAGGIELYMASFTSYLGYAHAQAGDVAAALPLLEEAVRHVAATTPVIAEHALRVAWLGDALLMAHRVDAAQVHAEQARELARDHGERGAEAWAWRLQGAVCEARGRRQEALGWYTDALARATDLGMRPLAVHAHLGLARVTTGDVAAGHREVAAATGRALAMRGPGVDQGPAAPAGEDGTVP
jgi:tetratricopeptide (TPR) repeat protein